LGITTGDRVDSDWLLAVNSENQGEEGTDEGSKTVTRYFLRLGRDISYTLERLLVMYIKSTTGKQAKEKLLL
jgi:hypothetical protein